MTDIPVKAYRENYRVYLVDTSCYGNVFYLSFHRWIANIKERYLMGKVPEFSDYFQKQGIKLIVVESVLKIFKEVKLHEDIKIALYCTILKKIKAELKYVILNKKDEKVAEAENTICFLDKNNKYMLIPKTIRAALEEILV